THNGSPSGSTTTGIDGSYSFSDLGPGVYTVSEETQTGWTQTYGNSGYTVAATSGDDSGNNNFGNFDNIVISGMKFEDENGNGQQDAGEPGLAGWTVNLTHNGSPSGITTTGADGSYSFSDLGPGVYTVSEVTQAGWTQTYGNSGYTVTATSGDDSGNNNFGNFDNIVISGMKFEDENGNGAQDAGEPGLTGWTVNLTKNGSPSGSTTTGADGSYSFSDLGPGVYSVSEVTQAGWTQTYGNSGYTVTATSGDDSGNNNFGNFDNIVISGMKFEDENGNGAQDAGEPGLAGWTVNLTKNGSPSGSTTTGADGSYSFSDLGPGVYSVSEETQTGWTQTYGNSGYTVTATSGDDSPDNNFGNFLLATISGQKFNDVNGDGDKDAGENGLEGWTIYLDSNNNGNLDVDESSTITNGSGMYTFTGLFLGTYRVREVLQSGWNQTSPNPSDIIVNSSGQTFSSVDLANFQLSSISGQKFNDMDGDGVKDAEDTGLQNWTIFLDNNGNDTLDVSETSTLTDASGNYSFNNLEPATYKVREVLQAGWLKTTINPSDIMPTSGQSITSIDFGNFKLVSISGQKFNDMNGNGIKDGGDNGLQNWTIFLDLNGNDSLNAGEPSTVTDVSGNYSFQNLTYGTYKVREVLQSGWTQTTSNPNDHVATSGHDTSGVDFGNFQRISISGQKFDDLNGNGSKDGGEPGISGWTIFIDANGNDSLDAGETNQLTDGTGNYSFTNVAPGTYKVREVIQSGWIRTSSNPSDIAATSGNNVSNVDFGNFKLVTISGMKFNDVNGNGVKDAGDNGLANWTIFFDTDNDGTLDGGEISVTTDVNGNYTFTGVLPGTYKVREVVQSGWLQTTVQPADITTSSGTNVSGINFGNFQYATISGMKFNDLNGNGVKDLNEPGLANWKIRVAGPKNDSALTNASGNYTITGLLAGTYTVTEELQAGWIQTTTNPAPIALVSGQTVSNVNFGNFKNPVIAGMKFNDANGNGVKDAGEGGLAGWVIKATKGATVKRTTTIANGTYSFTFTQAEIGTWVVSESLIIGWQQTAPPAGIYTILVQSAVDSSNTNFGNLQLGKISGKMYVDVQGDSTVPTGDSVLAGWVVKLFRNGSQVQRQVTTDSGYTFYNLTAGTYIVQESLKAGWLQTVPRVVNSVAPVLNPNAGPRAYSVVISSGSDVTGKDFANFQYGSISGTKFHDLDGDSTKDAGEPVLANWIIRLKKNGVLVNSATTNASGNYSFTNLTAGSYNVSESLLVGWTQTLPASLTYTLTVNSGSVYSAKDFGNLKLSSISGLKFFDSDSSGTKNTCEAGLSGFKIELTKGAVKETLTTASDGSFSFTNKLPGTYTLREIQKTGWSQTKPAGGASYTIAISSGVDTSGFQFGNFYLADATLMRTMLLYNFDDSPRSKNTQGYTNGKPTGGNVKDTVFLRRAFGVETPQDSGLLRLGIKMNGTNGLPDSSLYYGWLFYNKIPPFQLTYHPTEIQTSIYNDWTYASGNRPVYYFKHTNEKNTATEFANFGNTLSMELTVLKTNVAASDIGVFPSGLGDLIYSSCAQGNGADSVLVGKSVRTIIAMADSALTLGKLPVGVADTVFRWPISYLYMLNTALARIDSEFYSATIDTFSTKPLRIKGIKALYKSTLLRRDPNTIESARRFVVPNYATEVYEPTQFSLEQNYPNPFNPVTTISFDLIEPAKVTLKIYNVVGQEVATLFNNEDLGYGRQFVQFDGGDLASGVYFYKLEATATDDKGVRSLFTNIKKMLLVK
ncbi:MAG: T9SS type A sorting domain-containing protein, partial [Bacteroidetes bacterium]